MLERGPAPMPVDYTGLPLNDEGRARRLSYNESQLAMIERQCEGWPPFYLVHGPVRPEDLDRDRSGEAARRVAWTIGAWEDRAPTTIWMDGRPHPSTNAAHPRGGFTTGTWEGDTLVADTTHMKAGFIRRTARRAATRRHDDRGSSGTATSSPCSP